MNRNMKLLIIGAVLVLSILSIFPNPRKKLKPGIDLGGGTMLLYQIDTTGLAESEKKEIAQSMIQVLKRRVDPSGKLNLVFRAHGSDRIEIQMPLATEANRRLRKAYQEKLSEVEKTNLNLRQIRLALIRPAGMDESTYLKNREDVFASVAGADPTRTELLNELAKANDEQYTAEQQLRKTLKKVNQLSSELEADKLSVKEATQLSRDWPELADPNRVEKVTELAGKDQAKQDKVKQFVLARRELTKARSDIETVHSKFDDAWKKLELNNIHLDRLEKILEDRIGRDAELAKLKEAHPALEKTLDELVTAYDAYQAVAGRLDDAEHLKRLVKGSGVLEFRILPTREQGVISDSEIQRYRQMLTEYGPKKHSEDDLYRWFAVKTPEEFKVGDAITQEFAGRLYVLASNKPGETLLHEKTEDTWRLAGVSAGSDRYGRPCVNFEMNEIGAKYFRNLTSHNLQRPLCILLDDEAISAPNIQSVIGKRGEITGRFTEQDVNDLRDILHAGSLPARLSDQPISQNTVGPTIGKDNLNAGFNAGRGGLIAVIVFMLAYYLVAGALADIALVFNMLIIVAVMAMGRWTFTMPGIAGLILTIGMSVDANVLIFERIREEQQRGSSLRMAVKNGYSRAFRTIFDANLTTFITALILLWFASPEVKGFAITLMIGLASSMFTALFVTRAIFDVLLSTRILKDHLKMLQVIKSPNVNWMSARPIFFLVSSLMVIGGWAVFLGRDEQKNSKYSIEFTGGTSVHVQLNESGKGMDRADVEQAVDQVGRELGRPGLESARVQSIGDPSDRKFEIVTTDTNQVKVQLACPDNTSLTAEQLQSAIRKAGDQIGDRRLAASTVKAENGRFLLQTDQANINQVQRVLNKVKALEAYSSLSWEKPVVDEIVSNAILKALRGKLDVQDDLSPQDVEAKPITKELISQKPYLNEYLGGLWLSCKFAPGKADTLERLKDRFDKSRYQSEFSTFGPAPGEMVVLAPNNAMTEKKEALSGIEVVMLSDDFDYRTAEADQWNTFQKNEIGRFKAVLGWKTSLPQVTQIDPSVGRKSMNDARVAIVLSLLAIIAYIWFRFGTVRFGMTAVIALIHDVSIAMGMVAASAWLSQTAIGKALLISDFKIDLPMIAGFLTVIGYSLNDTIVLFDRVRENRGKMALLSPNVINRSINQTLSRTILTSFTTLLVLIVMYIWGGEGLRGFNYVLIIGIVVGTYSSIGIATPLLYGVHKEEKKKS